MINWRANTVGEPDFSIRLHQNSGLPILLREGKSCLLVLDYAETRTKEIIECTEIALRAPNAPFVRLVLLAREGGDWWDRLHHGARTDKALAAILSGIQTKTGPYRMANERIETDERMVLFLDAIVDFARAKEIPVPAWPAPELTDDLFWESFLHPGSCAGTFARPAEHR